MKVSMRHDGSELHLVVVDLGSTQPVGTCEPSPTVLLAAYATDQTCCVPWLQ